MITIYDLADKTGYSPSTVSKVLNNYKGVSENARNTINKAVEELHYVPNLNARMLMTKKSYMIGVLFHEESNIGMLHPHFAETLEYFKETVEEYGYDVVFLNRRIGKNDITLLEHCKHRGLDGVMIAVSGAKNNIFKNELEELFTSDIPKISIEEEYPNTPLIVSDHYNGAKQAIEHLYNLGHRKIGIICLKDVTMSARLRKKAYIDFLKEKNIPYDESLVYEGESFTYKEGLRIGDKICESSNMPTAFFCVYDEIAMGVMEVFNQNNIAVPDDISIIGFDDIPIARLLHLTTIRQNRREIGVQAAKSLIDNIESEIPIENKLIPTNIKVRNSTKEYR